MNRRRRRRFAIVGLTAALVALTAVGAAAADPVARWSGSKGAFAWETHRSGCGKVGHTASVVAAHTRWRTSPARGYVRLTFIRQLEDEQTGAWTTVHRQRRSTRNTSLEGERGVVHWRQWFFPFADEAGATSRHIVIFEWLRERKGDDRLELRRKRTFAPCVVR
jgi:hypothetical protein